MVRVSTVDELLGAIETDEPGSTVLSGEGHYRMQQTDGLFWRRNTRIAIVLPALMHRVILHLDMDAFYASVEQRDDPSLKGKPVIVGAPPTQRGVVCAASYEARRFGVRSAMPSVTAGRLCPRGVFLRPRMDVYVTESREIMALVREAAGDKIEPMSIDEAYVDVSAACQAASPDESLECALPLARRIKEVIRERRRLTATIGIAPNKLLAKLERRRLAAHTVQVKVRYGDFTTLTRQMSVDEPFAGTAEIYRLGCWLLAKDRLVHRPLRLLGLGVSGLVDRVAEQLHLPLAPGIAARH